MSKPESRVIPDDYYSFSLKDLDTFIQAIERRLEAREVMRIEQAAEFLNVSMTTIHLLCKK